MILFDFIFLIGLYPSPLYPCPSSDFPPFDSSRKESYILKAEGFDRQSGQKKNQKKKNQSFSPTEIRVTLRKFTNFSKKKFQKKKKNSFLPIPPSSCRRKMYLTAKVRAPTCVKRSSSYNNVSLPQKFKTGSPLLSSQFNNSKFSLYSTASSSTTTTELRRTEKEKLILEANEKVERGSIHHE